MILDYSENEIRGICKNNIESLWSMVEKVRLETVFERLIPIRNKILK